MRSDAGRAPARRRAGLRPTADRVLRRRAPHARDPEATVVEAAARKTAKAAAPQAAAGTAPEAAPESAPAIAAASEPAAPAASAAAVRPVEHRAACAAAAAVVAAASRRAAERAAAAPCAAGAPRRDGAGPHAPAWAVVQAAAAAREPSDQPGHCGRRAARAAPGGLGLAVDEPVAAADEPGRAGPARAGAAAARWLVSAAARSAAARPDGRVEPAVDADAGRSDARPAVAADGPEVAPRAAAAPVGRMAGGRGRCRPAADWADSSQVFRDHPRPPPVMRHGATPTRPSRPSGRAKDQGTAVAPAPGCARMLADFLRGAHDFPRISRLCDPRPPPAA